MTLIYDIVQHTARIPRSLTWLTEKLQCSERELRTSIKKGQAEGFLVHITGQEVFTRLAVGPGPLVTIGEATPGRHQIVHLTDTHAGSRHFAKKAMQKFLGWAWKQGCRSIAFTGDGTDGAKTLLVPEQRYTSADDQIYELVTSFQHPWEVAAITGNHDGYSSNAIGLDIGRIIAERATAAGMRWLHAGTCRGNAVIEGARTHLWHPMGAASTPNAIRRMLNTHAERLQEPTDLIVSGHLHHYGHVHVWPEDIYATAGGTFQLKKYEFSNRISAPWDVGGTIITFTVDKRGRASQFNSKFIPAAQFVS